MVQGKFRVSEGVGAVLENLCGAFQQGTWASRALVVGFSGDIWVLRLIIFKVILSRIQQKFTICGKKVLIKPLC